MAWLNYSDGEVNFFHPVFQLAGDLALADLGLDGDLMWDHHPSDSLVGTPDFVLRHIPTGRWIVAIEIKRTQQAVWSSLFQLQAKGYAEGNQTKYRQGWPAYYAITNLELLVLGALNGARPPRECVIQGGVTDTGRLGSLNEPDHRSAIRLAIAGLVQHVMTIQTADFDLVWPGIIEIWLSNSEAFPVSAGILLPEPSTPGWDVVRDYFADDMDTASRRALLLRCLALEYLRGTLYRFGHPQVGSVPPLRPGGASVAASLTAIRAIDFDAVFEPSSAAMYTGLTAPESVAALGSYIQDITVTPYRVADLARNRVDAPSLLDSLLTSITPFDRQQASGKVQTDPELSALLATLAISDAASSVIDIGCGDGSLISAAHDRLVLLGAQAGDVQLQLSGIEADPISLRIAAMRLALKEPRLVNSVQQAELLFGDAFAAGPWIGEADVILMNPPFKRYEAQDETPVPEALRLHYAEQISAAGGAGFSVDGQANLYSFYVEFVAAVMRPGAVVGLILDNKWYHNRYATRLRQLLIDDFEIIALVEYPHSAFFRAWMISTSLIIARRSTDPDPNHEVLFLRSRTDPRSTDLNELSGAVEGPGPWPMDWQVHRITQSDLDSTEGWKRHFAARLLHDYREWPLPTLAELFPVSRRGSLNKEGGGTEVLEFPFDRTRYGPRRARAVGGGPFTTTAVGDLTDQENVRLRDAAMAIPSDFRGYAIKNSDGIGGYELTEADLTTDMTIEPPSLRAKPEMYRSGRRAPWNADHENALAEMYAQPEMAAYLAEVDASVNLSSALPANQNRWVVLREPFAGELVVPRKVRGGHRVHVNPFALDTSGRQLRLSSNFISYGGLVAIDETLDDRTSLELIVSFLLSAFGQLQFESRGYNREGMLAVEKMHVDEMTVFDPRWVPEAERAAILAAFNALPYPIPPVSSAGLVDRTALDRLWAEQLAGRFGVDVAELLAEVQGLLDEYVFAREP